MARRPSAVMMANDLVSIITACQLVGMELPEGIAAGRSVKVHCPFGNVYHSDHGVAPAMRIYLETNSAYCFNCGASYRPVWLVAQARDQDPRMVALDLLDYIGHRPLSLADAFAAAGQVVVAPEPAHLAEALQIYCRRVAPDWTEQQFDPAVATTLTRCLELLDRVSSDGEAEQWLNGCKTVMSLVLNQDGL